VTSAATRLTTANALALSAVKPQAANAAQAMAQQQVAKVLFHHLEYMVKN